MHESAMKYGKLFFNTYCPQLQNPLLKIVEIGSQDVNGSLRSVAPESAEYVGLDFVEGDGVDIIISDPYKLPVQDKYADIVVTSSCFEHSEFFWLVYLEALRILKPNGLLYINVPSNGYYHKWPVDCWRFYPDAGYALEKWGRRNSYDVSLLESFVGERSSEAVGFVGMWNDFVSVFIKSIDLDSFPHKKIVNNIEAFYNGFDSAGINIINEEFSSPDFLLIEECNNKIQALNDEIFRRGEWGTSLDAEVSKLQLIISKLQGELDQSNQWALSLNERLNNLYSSTSWRFTKPFRLLKGFLTGFRR